MFSQLIMCIYGENIDILLEMYESVNEKGLHDTNLNVEFLVINICI